MQGCGITFSMAIHHDVGTFQGGHSADEKFIEYGEELVDPGTGIDDLDDHGNVLGERPGGGLDQSSGTQAHDSFKFGCAGHLGMAGGFDEALMGGCMRSAIRGLQIDTQENLFAEKAHGARLSDWLFLRPVHGHPALRRTSEPASEKSL